MLQHVARPSSPPRACPACGGLVDPLRAREVMLLDDGFRFFCDLGCRDGFTSSERERLSSLPPPAARKDPTLRRDPTPRPMRLPLAIEERAAPEPAGFPWLAVASGVLAALVGAMPGPMALAWVSALLSCGAAAATLIASFPTRREVGVLAWSLGPVGVVLAATAALLARLGGDASPGLSAFAAIAAALVAGRSFLDARARHPVDRAVGDLLHELASTVRVPVKSTSSPTEVLFREVETSRVRTGEEVLAIEGDTLGVDGVVRAGEAWALLHPGATSAVPRSAGDPLLAGARIVEGEVLLLVTRVGDDRALARPRRFGGGREAAAITILTRTITGWGGLAAIAGALTSLFIATDAGIAARLSAAGAVLIAAPLLAVRRSGESPLVAAAAAAAARGIVFSNPRALELAGRASVAAVFARGTVTEGLPEVVEAHAVDGSDTTPLIALAAAAESAADPHPIARAISRFAEERRIAPESVRRAAFSPGRGVTALTPSGEAFVLGNRQLLLDEGVSVAVAEVEATRAEAAGRTVLFLGLGGKVRAVLSLEDARRPGARAAVQRLFDLRLEVVLLSGDHRGTAEVLARGLDIGNVRAELLPEERGSEIYRLRETGGVVAAIGKPTRDDAALAAADVPIALGAAGSAAAERSIALATDDLRDAAAALWIARAARAEAWRSGLFAVLFGSITVAAAALGLAGPAIAAAAAIAVDSFALPSGARVRDRVERRIPARS